MRFYKFSFTCSITFFFLIYIMDSPLKIGLAPYFLKCTSCVLSSQSLLSLISLSLGAIHIHIFLTAQIHTHSPGTSVTITFLALWLPSVCSLNLVNQALNKQKYPGHHGFVNDRSYNIGRAVGKTHILSSPFKFSLDFY